jgi:hypothetical protein
LLNRIKLAVRNRVLDHKLLILLRQIGQPAAVVAAAAAAADSDN